MNNETSIADRLQRARQLRGLSRRRLSLAAGLSQTLVQRIEAGHISDPRSSTLSKLAATLDVSAAWLSFNIGEGPAQAA